MSFSKLPNQDSCAVMSARKWKVSRNGGKLANKVSKCSCEEGLLLGSSSWFRVALGARPAAQDKTDLVDKICDVVDDVQHIVVHRPLQESEEVAQRVDAPTKADNDAHVVERGLHGIRARAGAGVGLTSKDLVKDEAPASHADSEASPGVHETSLTSIAERKHDHSAEEELPEACSTSGCSGRSQDKVELNHLQRHSDTPVDVTVHHRGLVDLHPVLTHVHVVHASNQSDQSSNMQGGLPMASHGACLSIEEHRGCNHCDGDDPEGHGSTIMLRQERIRGVLNSEAH